MGAGDSERCITHLANQQDAHERSQEAMDPEHNVSKALPFFFCHLFSRYNKKKHGDPFLFEIQIVRWCVFVVITSPSG